MTLGLLAAINALSVQACTQDEAFEMYSTVNNHAAALQADAEANPSLIPFQKGKNDPRLKKSIKILDATAVINSEHLETQEFSEACAGLTDLAQKYKINLAGDVTTESKVRTGLKAAGQANSLLNTID